MGMAASQARYLGLTARKTNVEYEGQQVNQARTALANQSANTFNELLALEVPTAPSTQDYTTLQYSYQDGTNTETISDMSELLNDPDGYNYSITHYHYSDVFTGIMSKKTNPQVSFETKAEKSLVPKDNVKQDAATNEYTVNGQVVSKYDSSVQEQKDAYAKIVSDYPSFASVDVNSVYTYTDTDGKLTFTTLTDLNKAVAGTADLGAYKINDNVPAYVGNNEVHPYDSTDSEQKTALEQIKKQFPAESISSSDNIYTWTSGGKTYFATLEDLQATAQSAPDPSKPTENQNKLTMYDKKIPDVDKVKKLYNDSIIIVVLSSSFMQRGEISILNKWDKTNICLDNNIDLVVELPFVFATQSADIFAKGAIQILKNLKVDKLVFGSESNNIDNLITIANTELFNKDFSSLVKINLNNGDNYPTALAKAIKVLNNIEINKPNDLLGLSYIKEIIKQNSNIKPITIQRTNDYHDLTKNTTTNIVSASNIRNLLSINEDITPYLEKNNIKYLRKIDDTLLWNLLKYQIINNYNKLDKFQTTDEGIDNRIRKYINKSNSLTRLKENIKTKRYTNNKINRMFIHILTNFTKEEASSNQDITYIRVLGFNNKGKEYLNQIKKELSIPLITNGFIKDNPILEIEYRASYIYSLLTHDSTLIQKELRNKPIIRE